MAGAAIVLFLTLLFWLLWPIHVVVMEITASAGLFLAFRYWPPMQRWFLGLPWPHRLVLASILVAVVLGHFTLANSTHFPLVSWRIFAVPREDDPVRCREFLATTQSGRTVRLLVEQLFPSIVQFNPPVENYSPAMADLVHAMAREYDREHPRDAVQRVDLVMVAVKLHPTAAEAASSPSCQWLKRFDVSSARSN